MSYTGNPLFLYHAYALAAGGWVRTNGGQYTPLESIAPSVLSISGGFSSASAFNVNSSAARRNPFGERGPKEFFVHVGHAYTEVRGKEDDDEIDPMGVYTTTVRSVLDDFRINDVVHVEHAETVLTSVHKKPNGKGEVGEGEVRAGRSSMEGLRVAGKRVKLEKHDTIDQVATYGDLVKGLEQGALAGKGGTTDDWVEELAALNDLRGPKEKAPPYIKDITDRKSDKYVRVSLFKKVDAPGLKTYGSTIDLDGFGRIFLGEIFVSHGMKQLTMLRFDLGCDNCGGYGGSGGSTNGTTYP